MSKPLDHLATFKDSSVVFTCRVTTRNIKVAVTVDLHTLPVTGSCGRVVWLAFDWFTSRQSCIQTIIVSVIAIISTTDSVLNPHAVAVTELVNNVGATAAIMCAESLRITRSSEMRIFRHQSVKRDDKARMKPPAAGDQGARPAGATYKRSRPPTTVPRYNHPLRHYTASMFCC